MQPTKTTALHRLTCLYPYLAFHPQLAFHPCSSANIRGRRPAQIKLRQLNIPRLSNLEVSSRPRHHRHLNPRALQQARFIRPREPIRLSLCKRSAQQAKQRALRSLRMHHTLPRNRRSHNRPIRRLLHLLDRIHRRQPDNRRPMPLNRVNRPLNRRRIDQRSHRVMHQHHIVLFAVQRSQRVPYGFLTVIPALHHMHSSAQLMLDNLCLHALPLMRLHRHAHRIHPRHRKKRSQRSNQYWDPANFKKLFRGDPSRPTRGHPRTHTRCWNNHIDSHNPRSIQEPPGPFTPAEPPRTQNLTPPIPHPRPI
jgi:hypothetical protein